LFEARVKLLNVEAASGQQMLYLKAKQISLGTRSSIKLVRPSRRQVQPPVRRWVF
jgi:hypothetical protein